VDDHKPLPYRLPYLHLFNAVTDAIRAIEAYNYGEAHQILVRGQQRAEEAFIDYPDMEDE